MIWHSKYETGDEQIDSQHKEIFRLVESVIETSYANAGKIDSAMEFLAGYTATHFAHEEKLMDMCKYPLSDMHKKQHYDFVESVVGLMGRVAKESDAERNRTDIESVVVDWLADHVLGSDKIMAAHYRQWAAGQ